MGTCSTKNIRKYKEQKIFGVKPIPKRITKIINSQLEGSICKIYINENELGSGFLCKIPFPNEFRLLPVLITNNHVINKEYFLKNKIIKISLDDDQNIKLLKILSERKFYSNETYDISIIEIFPKADKLNNFLELDYNYEKNGKERKQNIYVLQYPKGNESCVSYGSIKYIKEYEIEHTCSTEVGSSGGPIILLDTFKVIGVHKGSGKNEEDNNYGTLLKYPISEFNKNFKEINKKKNEIKKEIKNGIKKEIKNEIKKEIKKETKNENKNEIEKEIKNEVKNENKNEIKKEIKNEVQK